MTRTYARPALPRLGVHHIAYLRALAEGVAPAEAARRYLGLEHGHQLVTLHQRLIDQLRALARRAGERRWRLIGLALGSRLGSRSEEVPTAGPPSLDEWARAEGLEDWSHAELLELYTQRFAPADTRATRKSDRNRRLRDAQLEVLARLEAMAAEPARPSDPIEAWFDPTTAERLRATGCLLLQDLVQRITERKAWWDGVPAVGPTKARRIERFLCALLPDALEPGAHGWGAGAGAGGALAPAGRGSRLAPALPLNVRALDGSQGANRSPLPPRIPASSDREAIEAWLAARVGREGEPGYNARTAATYRREAERWLMYCVLERGKPMSSADAEDCRAYMAWLNQVPAHWISRRRAARLDVDGGWAPFRQQPGLAARRLAVKVVHLMCGWLAAQRYLDHNPWALVNRALVDGDERPAPPTSRALTPQAYAVLLAALPEPGAPGRTRNGFVIAFTRYTGLRASELLRARLGDLRPQEWGGWQLHVVGKGRKARMVSVPSPALEVLKQYLAARGLPPVGRCPRDVPLLGSQDDPQRAPSYSAVYQSLSAHIRRAIRRSDLDGAERERAMRATQHWLRHTFATRAAEAEVPEDVLMAEMGHASRATTAGYYTAQDRRRYEEIERAATRGERL